MKKLLLVDDEQLTTISLEKMISESGLGYEVVGRAGNGEKALEFIRENPVDIAVVDIRMPVLDGLGLLRELKEMDTAPKVIILSAYRDFEYAQQALRYGACGYILKPVSVEKLFTELEHAALVVDQTRNAGQALDAMRLAKLQRAVRQLVDKGRVDESLPAAFKTASRGHLLMAVCEAEMPQPFADDCREHGWYAYNDRTLLRFLPDEQQVSDEQMIRMAEALRAASIEYYLPDIAMACSEGGITTATMPDAFNACKEAAEYYFYRVFEPVIPASSIHPAGIQDNRATLAEFEKLNELILLGKEEPVLAQLDALYHELRQSMAVPPHLVYRLFYRAAQSIATLLRKGKAPAAAQQAVDGITLAKLQGFRTFGSLYSYLTMHIQQFMGDTHLPMIENDDRIVEKTIQFCRDNYQMECSLDEIAANVHISKNYLSLQFKEHTGLSIWNYLTEVRIEKAKELLASDAARAVQVGEQVGYKNPSHFGKIFKSRVGMSPKEYQLRVLAAGPRPE